MRDATKTHILPELEFGLLKQFARQLKLGAKERSHLMDMFVDKFHAIEEHMCLEVTVRSLCHSRGVTADYLKFQERFQMKKTLLLIGDVGGVEAHWSQLIQPAVYLFLKEYNIVIIDSPSLGLSRYRWIQYGPAVIRGVLRHLDIDQVSVFSMGLGSVIFHQILAETPQILSHTHIVYNQDIADLKSFPFEAYDVEVALRDRDIQIWTIYNDEDDEDPQAYSRHSKGPARLSEAFTKMQLQSGGASAVLLHLEPWIGIDHQLGNASGPRTNSEQQLMDIAKSSSGAVCSKSATLEERSGNPQPRYTEIQLGDRMASINSEGLPNKGFAAYTDSSFLQRLKESSEPRGKPYILSISGLSLKENLEMLDRLAESPDVLQHLSAVEVNVACPNVPGKPLVGYDFPQFAEVVQAMSRHPLFAKDCVLGFKLPPYLDAPLFDAVAQMLNPIALGRGAISVSGMSGDRMAPWRKTGRKADARHFEGLEQGCLFEFAAYDDRHQQQGRGLGCIGERAIETHIEGGLVYGGQVLALEDDYYEYWFETTFGKMGDSPQVIFHFCDVPEHRCKSPTAYRDAIHVDVFRILTAKQAEKLHWLSDGCREREGQPAGPGAHDVQTGLAGVEGLARALGSGADAAKQGQGVAKGDSGSEDERKRAKKKEKKRQGAQENDDQEKTAQVKKRRKRSSSKSAGGKKRSNELRRALDKREPAEPRLSALDLAVKDKKEKKDTKKKKPKKKDSSSTARSPSSSSSSGELFHSAALPRGLERLRQVHQKKPGRLASLTLQRMKELVNQAQGRGTAEVETDQLPATATGYLAGVFLVQHSEHRQHEDVARTAHSGGRHRLAMPQRSSEGIGHSHSEIQGTGIGPQATVLDSSHSVGAGPQRRSRSGVPSRASCSPKRGQGGVEDSKRALSAGQVDPMASTHLDSRSPDKRKQRRRRQRRATPEQSDKRRRKERQGQGEERPVWAEMIVEDGKMILPALESALSGPEIDDATRRHYEELCRDLRLHRIYAAVLASYARIEDREVVYKDFSLLLVEWREHSVETTLKLLEAFYKPLVSEGGLAGDRDFSRVNLARQKDHRLDQAGGRKQRAIEGKLLGVVGSTQVRELFTGWEALDGGVYVGGGSDLFPTSIFQENYADNLSIQDVGRVLDGRPLYVDAGQFSTAADLVDKFSVDGKKPIWTWATCQAALRELLQGKVSVSLTGVVLKVIVRNCPGHLGNVVRMLPACARRHFRQSPVEVMPIAVPADSQDEIRLQKMLFDERGPRQLTEAERAQANELAVGCGTEAWLGLALDVLNAMFCGGSRPLGKVMPHPMTRTVEQETMVSQLRAQIELWTSAEGAEVELAPWESLSQGLGDFYTGFEVTKAYKLTWKAIAPHVPGPGEAGRVALADSVAPELKDYVLDPDLLRIPDDELGEIKHSAPVLVESSAEYDLIVENLVKAGMLEREVESETLKVLDKPVYNGMFGVHKSWIDQGNGDWMRTLRLIINLIPSNLTQRRMPQQPSKSMGYAPLCGSMALLEGEVVLSYGEDVRHCFHIFAPGEKWRGYFVLSMKAAGKSFNDGIKTASRPRVRSAPMGWANIVDFVQSSLERMGTLAGIPASRCVRMGEPSPLLELTAPRHYHSFYVDNYDGFTVVASTDLGLYEGKPSDAQLQLREVFKTWSIGRDEKKAAEGTLSWTSLGAEQLGPQGLVGSSRKFRRAVLGGCLNLLKMPYLKTSDQELLSLVGKLMHATQYCRPVACVFDELDRNLQINDPEVEVDLGGLEELMMLCGLLPLMWTSQRSTLNATVYATDASPDGGGACNSTALSPRGKAKLHLMCSETQGQEGGSCDSVLLIEMFGGMGGLRRAVELLGVLPQGIIFVDSSVHQTGKETLFICDHSGQYCQGRQSNDQELESSGAAAATSRLLDDMVKVAEELKQVSRPLRLPDWKVVECYENVVMDEADLTVQSEKIGQLPIMNEAADVLRCRRPRLYWIKGLDIIKGSDLELVDNQQVGELQTKLTVAKISTPKPPLEWFLRRDCKKFKDETRPFFTFARPIPRAEPPKDPAGYSRCDAKTLGRWRGDSFRLAPYQYSEDNLVLSAHGPRRLLSDEQMRMLGYNSDALDFKQKLSEDQRGQLIGNTFPVLVVARLLAGLAATADVCEGQDLSALLWQVWKSNEDKVQQLKETSWSQRFGPGAAGVVGGLRHLLVQVSVDPSQSPRSLLDPSDALTDEQLLVYLITRNVSHRGTDVNLDHGVPFSSSDFCRRSVDPSHWQWKVALSYKWKQPHAHITQLETVAVLDLLRKLMRTKSNHSHKTLLLVDNASVVGILAKGRTTAATLRQPLRRIAAILVATSSRLVVAWIKSEWNPADGPSRWVSSFIEELWEQGDPKGWAGDCLSGLGHFIPACKPYLVGSWRLHSAWGRAELPCRAPPFTPLLLYAVAQSAVNHDWTDLAVLLILGFHTFARAGELFQAKAGDFLLGPRSGTWTLPLSKGGQRQGVTESILLTDPFVIALLRNFLRFHSPGDPLSKVSGGTQRKRLNDLLLGLHISFPFRWYSVRRGGATHAYRTTNNLAAICVKGRWNSLKTARIYISDAVAQLTELQLSDSKMRSLRRLAVICRPSFEQAVV
eukprot:s3166_g5.t1